MDPVHLDFIGDLVGDEMPTTKLRVRVRSKDFNSSQCFVEATDGMLPEAVFGKRGVVKGNLTRSGGKNETADEPHAATGETTTPVGVVGHGCIILPAAGQPVGGLTEAEAQLDTVEMSNPIGKENALPEGSLGYGRWMVTGSRFLATLVDDVGSDHVPFQDGVEKISLCVQRPKKEEVQALSGHAVNTYIIRPSLMFEVDINKATVATPWERRSEWRSRIEGFSSVLSFHSRAPVEWFSEEIGFQRPDGKRIWLAQCHRLRRVVRTPPADCGSPRTEVPVSQALSEMAADASRLTDWGAQMKSAIDFYIASYTYSGVTKFFALTTALEAAKAAYLNKVGGKKIMGSALWKRFKTHLGEEIEKHLEKERKGTVQIGAFKRQTAEKIAELNRPSYRTVVDRMIKSLPIHLKDIYPDYPKDFEKFLKIRNELIHEGKIPDQDILEPEMMRVEQLVERVIISALKTAPADLEQRSSSD